MADQPPTIDERLTAMHVTLREMLLVVRAAADQHDGDFANASPARAEWNEVPDGMSGDLRQAYETGLVLWHAILDHGHGLADLIDTRRTYGAMTVSRALAEAAARSWQLLEEGLSPHDRVERMLNERLYASHENELLLRGLLPNGAQTPNVSSVAKAKAPVIHRRLDAERTNRQQLLDTARRHQIAPIRERTGRPASVGRGRATSMDVLNRLLQHGPQASSFFRMNSAVAHTSLHAQVRLLYMVQRSDGSHTSKPLPMHPDDLAPQAWPAVAATAIGASTLFAQAGWPTTALDAAIGRLIAEWDALPDEALLQEFDALA